MKKIIELAEKVFNARIPALTSDIYELGIAISKRRKLEQTSITEEWLTKHGWKIHKVLHYAYKAIDYDYIEYDVKERVLEVFRNYYFGNGAYADALIDNVDNMAKLYDACELCGIELE